MLSFTVSGEKKLNLKLNIIEKAVKNLKPVFQDSGKKIIEELQSNLKSGNSRHKFSPWSPLAAKTQEMRSKRVGYYRQSPTSGAGMNPLLWTGRLSRGFVIDKVDNKSLVIINKTGYFPYHQLGNGHPPRRVSMDLNKKIIMSVVEIFNNHLNKAIKK